ncbi:hypothetical protein COHA_010711 [Chlorella ohadii]|uniref:Uncharacterized protein n=1 Tax=Chlorella ohadii TaxID=2649997 RepID=A0AAD5DFT5_9CHLO|nr:hypothetical protein COHA_010711 [Chlorella ohadii]
MSGYQESSYRKEEESHQKSGTGGLGTPGATTGMTGTGTGTGMTGTGEGVGQKISRKAGEAWEGAKEAMPGTAEHRATHPTSGTGMTGTTGTTHTSHTATGTATDRPAL